MEELVDELRQPLAAACNYVSVVRLMIQSNALERRKAADSLIKAETQILRAGEIARRIRQAVQTEAPRR
jgi:phosphoglycerate-specific signal transduction histidine kinase